MTAGRTFSVSIIGGDSHAMIVESTLHDVSLLIVHLCLIDFTDADPSNFLLFEEAKLDLVYLEPFPHGFNAFLHDC